MSTASKIEKERLEAEQAERLLLGAVSNPNTTNSIGSRAGSEELPIWAQRAQRLGELRGLQNRSPPPQSQPQAQAQAQPTPPPKPRPSNPASTLPPPSRPTSVALPRPSASSSSAPAPTGKTAITGALVQEINLDDLDETKEEDIAVAVYRATTAYFVLHLV